MAVAADPVPGTGCQSDLGAAGDRDCHFTDHFRIPSVFTVYGHSSAAVLIFRAGWFAAGECRQDDLCFLGFSGTGLGWHVNLRGLVSGLPVRFDRAGEKGLAMGEREGAGRRGMDS